MITSGEEGEEEARSAVPGEDYQVSTVLSAGSLMLVLCASPSLCLWHARPLTNSGASPSMPWNGRRRGMMRPASSYAHCTRTTPTSPPGLTSAPGFFTQAFTHPPSLALTRASTDWPETPMLQAQDSLSHGNTHGISLTSL